MRLFIAIVPDEKVLSSLKALQERAVSFSPPPKAHEEYRVAKDGSAILTPRAPWRASKDLHITLQFLGNEVNLHQCAKIKQTLASSCQQLNSFDMECSGFGAFPNAKNARILWAGLSSPELEKCAKSITEQMSSIGFKPDKPFSAHVTLARTKFLLNAEKEAEAFKSIKWHDGKWHASEIKLIESVPELGGYEYKVLEKYLLLQA